MSGSQSGLVRRVQAGGVWLAYRSWGPAKAPPVVLLHALGEASPDWAPVAAALTPAWRVYAPDLRGHGASDWPGSYTIEQLTTDLAAFLDALDLDQVTLGGHSIGGPPAYLYAARHPDRVTRLVLEDPAPPWPRAPRVVVRPEGPLPFDWGVTALSNEFTGPHVSSWRDSLRHIQAPALLVAGGSASHVDQGQLADMATLIPDCELITIPAGHLVHAVRPAEFTAAVTGFLRRPLNYCRIRLRWALGLAPHASGTPRRSRVPRQPRPQPARCHIGPALAGPLSHRAGPRSPIPGRPPAHTATAAGANVRSLAGEARSRQSLAGS